jgi:hypothetical protein
LRKIYIVILLFAISLLATPTLCLQGIQNISSYGVVNYGVSGMRWLRTNGKWIVDEDGNVVILRGANFMGYEFGAWDTHTEEDYARMASWGFNVVRLPIAWAYIEQQPGAYDSGYLRNYVDKDIAWAKKYGIYIVLDMHQWRWSPYWDGEGMPAWMVSGYPQNDNGRFAAVSDFWAGKGPNATEASPLNPSMQDRFIAMWKFVANYYANESTIAAYEVFNEPNGNLEPWDVQTTQLYPFYETIIDEIRSVDANHIIIYEPMGYFDQGNAKLAKNLIRPNLVASFHFYDYQPYTSTNAAQLENSFISNNPLTKPNMNWTIPVLVGEFGIDADSPNAGLWMKDVISIFNKYQVGWTVWAYGKYDSNPMVLLYSNGTERTRLTTYLKLR